MSAVPTSSVAGRNANAFIVLALATTLTILMVPVTVVVGQHSSGDQNHTNVCLGRTTGNERHVGNCQQFFRCQDGRPFLNTCNQNMVYSHLTQRCENSNSTTQAQCFRCPTDGGLSDWPADFQCHQYVRCFRGHAEQRSCNDGLLFDPVLRQCNFAARVKCPCPATDRPETPWFIRERENCARFNVCVRGVHVPLQCPPGLHFNRTSSQCDVPQEPQCILWDELNQNNTTTERPPTNNTTALPEPSSSPPTPPPTVTELPPPFRCPSNDAITFEPHPSDCEQFYICAYGNATISVCPNGSLFDATSRSCVDANFARCFNRRN